MERSAEVLAYVAALPPQRRPLFDRVDALLEAVCPAAQVVLAYRMPTYVVGERSLHVGVWAHGVSFYGWEPGRDDGFAARHPELDSGKGTLRLTLRAAALLPDGELEGFFRAVLAPADSVGGRP